MLITQDEYDHEVVIDPFYILGVSFDRHEINSLRVALQTLLHEPVQPFYDIVSQSGHQLQNWSDLLDAILRDPNVDVPRWRFDQLLTGSHAGTGILVSCLALHLARAYPEAKVVLTTVDGNGSSRGWLTGVRDTILPYAGLLIADSWVDRLTGHLTSDPRLYGLVVKAFRIMMGPGVDLFNDDQMAAGYEAWTARIRARVPANRLLVYNVCNGWQPLCHFLKRPIPDKEFPQAGDRLRSKIDDMIWKRKLVAGVFYGAAAVVAGYMVYKLWHRVS